MLTQLSIRNFALVEELAIEFGPGFNVLTGETGAGKSVLIDALSSALGERQSGDVVRSGTDRALIEAVFEVGAAAGAPLAEWAEEGSIILGREISATGRSVYRINGRMCTAAAVRAVAAGLLDLHGQHEHQSLLDADRHADYLDNWAGADLLAAKRRVLALHAELREVARQREALRRSERETAQRLDLYRFQMEEIDAAALTAGEEEALDASRLLLANAEKLHTATGGVMESLGQGEPCATDLLAAAAVELGAVAAIDPRLAAVAELVESAAVAAQEATRDLRAYHESVEFNPERLQQVMERLDLLRRLKRKYGETVEEILDHRRRIAVEIAGLEGAEEHDAALAASQEALARELAVVAARVWEGRRAAAVRFSGLVATHLAELAMEGTRFETGVETGDAGAWERGAAAVLGRIEFLISPNPGEPLRPLAKIVSGGELSRVMLALKSVMATASPVHCLVFDEIDVGVGGRTAAVLGRKLAALAETNQVLCITHLPPIASRAATHFHVRKRAAAGRTRVEVRRLQGDSRVAELARMLGGAEATATRHAEQLLAEAGAPRAAAR
jgi:DNA repair protein RecN (Recombination protein N)